MRNLLQVIFQFFVLIFFLFILFELKSSLINISILWGSEKYFYFSRTFYQQIHSEMIHKSFTHKFPSFRPSAKKKIYVHASMHTAKITQQESFIICKKKYIRTFFNHHVTCLLQVQRIHDGWNGNDEERVGEKKVA